MTKDIIEKINLHKKRLEIAINSFIEIEIILNNIEIYLHRKKLL